MTEHAVAPGSPNRVMVRCTPRRFLLWDGTDPQDSVSLAVGLRALGFQNLADALPPTTSLATQPSVATAPVECFATPHAPRLWMPAPSWNSLSLAAQNDLWYRGMFEHGATFLDPTARFGGAPDVLAFSGHGMPGFLFGDSMQRVAGSTPVTCPQGEWGTAAMFSHWRHVPDAAKFPAATKVVILSACRQLSGALERHRWASRMHNHEGGPVILTYRDTGPGPGVSAVINRRFLQAAREGAPLVRAWRSAHASHQGNTPLLRDRWAALAWDTARDAALTPWCPSGQFATPGQRVLYFDEEHPNGVPITPPREDFEVWLSARGAPDVKFPPWSLMRPGATVTLNVRCRGALRFEDDDELWIACQHVRPDYEGGIFDIHLAAQIDDPTVHVVEEYEATGASHEVLRAARMQVPLGRPDAFLLKVRRAEMSWLSPSSGWDHLQVPLRLGGGSAHTPAFYFQVGLFRTRGGHRVEHGIPTVSGSSPTATTPVRIADHAHLIHYDQFAHFILPAARRHH